MRACIFGFFIVADALGIVGACLIAVPFFREDFLKLLLSRLNLGVPIRGAEDLEDVAREDTRSELESFNPTDRFCALAGLFAIVLSYGLHMYAEWLDFVRGG